MMSASSVFLEPQHTETTEEHLAKCARSRLSSNKEWHHRQAEELRKEAFAYCKFFCLPKPKIMAIPALDSKLLEKIRKLEAQPQRKQNKQSVSGQKLLPVEQDLITKWRSGEYSGCFYEFPVMLRIDGDEVLTSRGARFPISHAKRALAFIRGVRQSGQAYVHNGRTNSSQTNCRVRCACRCSSS